MDQRGKRLFTIAAIVILLFLGITAYFLFFKKTTTQNQVSNVDTNLVPFDQRTLQQINELPSTETPVDQTPVTETDNTATPISSRERLRKITSFPVSGFTSFITNSLKKEIIIDEKTNKEKEVSTPITIHHIRYNDQRNGHIFDGVITDESILNKKITKTDLPTAEEFILNKTGSIGYLRYEKDNKINTFKLTLPSEKTTTIPKACTTFLTSDLKIKDRNDQVKILQDYMNYKFNQTLKIDGIFGIKTQGSVKTIQKMFNLPETGVVDQATREAISTECTTIQQELSADNNPKDLTGSLVSGYIQQFIRSPEDGSFFTLERTGGKTIGVFQSFENNRATQVFESSFNEWFAQYVNKNLITLTTYASGTIDGYMYGLDPIKQTFSKLLGPFVGLTTNTAPDGKHVLATFTINNQLKTQVLDISNGTNQSIPFVVLPEKCVWYSSDIFYCGVPVNYPNGLYPDDWYKGLVSFSDVLWSYTLSTQSAVQVVVPPQPLDIFRMESDPTTGYLFFMNKNNYELWSYRVGGLD